VHTITPSLVDISRMTHEQCTQIQNFTVSNMYGRIMWEGRTDVTNVNLGRTVVIKKTCVNVYPEYRPKHDFGQKLNKPALVYLTKFETK
jgi:hypothetical protein